MQRLHLGALSNPIVLNLIVLVITISVWHTLEARATRQSLAGDTHFLSANG